MESSKKRNIFISIALLFVVIGSFGYSLYNKEDEAETVEADQTEVVDDSVLVIDEAGSVALEDKYEKVIINVPGVEVTNGSAESILVTEDVGDGDVTLHNVRSKELILQGGGPNSIMVSGSSEVESIFFERLDGALAVRVQDDSIVKDAFIAQTSQDAILEGNFTNVIVEASDIKVDIQDGIIESLSVAGRGATIYANKNTSINSIIILAQAEKTSFTSDGNIASLIVDSTNSNVNLNGKIETVYVRDGAESAIVTLAEGAVLESFITSVPVTLNGKGKVNKVVADSDSDVTGDMEGEEAAPLTNNKKETVNATVRVPSRPKKITTGTKTPKLAAVKNQKLGKAKASKLKEAKSPRSNKSVTDKKEDKKDSNKDKKTEAEDPEIEVPEEIEEESEGEDESEKDEELPNIEGNPLAKEVLETNLDFIYRTIENPGFGTGAGEWSILSLARGGYDASEEYYDKYFKNVEKSVEELMEKYDGKLHRAKGSEHSRLMLAYGALGKDITDVAGYDIREGLADFDFATRQGINGPIFALIALDTHGYDIPIIQGIENQSTREKFIDYILDREITQDSGEVGGWSLFGGPDVDITGMAIQALTPYYEEQKEVKDALDRGIDWLSTAQSDAGGYSSAWGGENIESLSQVIVALTGLGIDPHTDPRFVKNGNSAIDNSLTFAVSEGGFMHVKAGDNSGGGAVAGQVDGMATDQGTYALVAYNRFLNKQKGLYDMSDVVLESKPSKTNKEKEHSKVDTTEKIAEVEEATQETVEMNEEISNEGPRKSTKDQEVSQRLNKKQIKKVEDVEEFTDTDPAENLSEIKTKAQEELLNYLDMDKFNEDVESIEEVISDGETKIEEATTPEDITEILKDIKKLIDELSVDEEIEKESEEVFDIAI